MGRINQRGMRVVKDEKINTDCNDKLETFRLNFSRCTNRDVAPFKVRDLGTSWARNVVVNFT